MRKCDPEAIRTDERIVHDWSNDMLLSALRSIRDRVEADVSSITANGRAYHRFARREARLRGLL